MFLFVIRKAYPVITGKIPLEKSKYRKGTTPYATTLTSWPLRWGSSPEVGQHPKKIYVNATTAQA